LLALLLTWGFWPRPVPVETAECKTGSLRVTVNEEGKTRIRQRYIVSAPVTGLLRRIPFKAGEPIDAHQQAVAVIDPIPPALLDARSRSLAEARRDTAVAQLEKARAAQLFAASELKRIETLSKARTVSDQDLENAQWRETAAARELSAAESALRQAEAELVEYAHAVAGRTNATRAPIEVKSPERGRVLHVFEESTRVVPAGTPLLEIGDPTDLEVVIECLSRDGAVITPGMAVELEQWGGLRPLQARVRLVEPAAFTKVSALGVEEQRVNVVADLLTPPAERGSLGDQFRVEARIITWQADSVLKVPSGALFRRGSEWHAFVTRGNRAELRAVKTGQVSGTETQILEGLRAGESVILYPGDRVDNGTRIKTVKL
jgi:HlyD family secretion protein